MPFDKNRIFSIDPVGLLSVVDIYNKGGHEAIGSGSFCGNRVVIEHENNQWRVSDLGFWSSIYYYFSFGSSLAEKSIKNKLKHNTVCYIDNAHKSKIRAVVKGVFGDEKKLANIKFVLLTDVDWLDINSAQKVVSVFCDFSEAIKYVEEVQRRPIIARFNELFNVLDFRKAPVDEVNASKEFLNTLDTALTYSSYDQRQNIIEMIIEKFKRPNFNRGAFFYPDSATKLFMIFNTAFEQATVENKKPLIAIINRIAKFADFREWENAKWVFGEPSAIAGLLNTFMIAFKYSDKQEREQLTHTFNNIVKRIILHKLPVATLEIQTILFQIWNSIFIYSSDEKIPNSIATLKFKLENDTFFQNLSIDKKQYADDDINVIKRIYIGHDIAIPLLNIIYIAINRCAQGDQRLFIDYFYKIERIFEEKGGVPVDVSLMFSKIRTGMKRLALFKTRQNLHTRKDDARKYEITVSESMQKKYMKIKNMLKLVNAPLELGDQ